MSPTDRPDDFTLEDDEALDQFMERYHVESARAAGNASAGMRRVNADAIPTFSG